MAKSPNGKIVKSLYLKIAYVWTRPQVHLSTFFHQIYFLSFCFISNPGTCVYLFHPNVCFSFVRYISSQVHGSTFFPFQCISFLLLFLHLTYVFLRRPMYVFSSVISHPRYTGLPFPFLCVFSFIICPYRLCVSETFFCISHVYLFHPMCVFPFLSTYPYFFYPIFSFVISPMGTRVYLFAM